MTKKPETNEALEFLRIADNLLECAFWAADDPSDNKGKAIACTIMEAQEKLAAAVVLLKGEAKPEREAT